jgi:hypothetical protein
MVKLAIQVVRDAQYESQSRTVDVSNKPAVGKSLFSEQLAQSSGGSFQATFETERFVHGKLREFTLRSASHWKDVRAVLPDKTAQVNDSTFNVEHIKEIEDSLMYRIFAESMDHTVGNAVLASIPKALRAYVLAQMICNSDMSVMNNAESVENRTELQARLTLRRVLRRVGFNSMNATGLLVVASVVKDQADSDKMNAESSKLQRIQRDSSSSTVGRYQVAKGIEEGFGTAPIWYQQSMANGPPVHRSRWIMQSRATCNRGQLQYSKL